MRGNHLSRLALAALCLGSGLPGSAFAQVKAVKRPVRVAVVDDSPLSQPRVFWKSGEYLDGQLTAATDHSFSMQSDLFAEPVELGSAELDRIELPQSTGKTEATGAFSVLFKNGDRLFADITGFSAAGVALKSTRHGEFTVPLASVQTLQRLHGGQVLYAGPTGAEGWRHYGLRDAQGFPWSAGARGSMISRVWNRSAMLEMEMPDKVEVEVVLSSTGLLRFAFCLGQASNSSQIAAVETWQDDLVIAQMNRFVPVMRLKDDDHSLALRLFWDRPGGKMTLCDWSGKQLAEFKSDPMTLVKPCVLVRNKGANLTLERAVVRGWDGGAIAQRDPRQPSVETMDGVRAQGAVQLGADGTSITVNGAVVKVDQLLCYEAGPDAATAAKLDGLHTPLAQMITAPASVPAVGTALVQYSDGTMLAGTVSGLAGEALQIKSSTAGQVVSARLAGMKRLLFNGGQAANWNPDEMDSLHVGSIVLHGKLEGTGDAKLRWRLPGAGAPVAVAKRNDIEVRRPAPNLADLKPSPALFFLKDGNVLGASLSGISAEAVTMTSTVAEINSLEPSQLNAIHFNSRKVESTGFTDPSWQILKGTEKDVQRKDADKILLTGPGAWGHPSVLAGDELSFTMSMPSFWGALAVDLFVGDFENRTKGAQLHLIYSGSDFWCVLETGENNSRSSEQLRNLTTKTINVRLVFSESNVAVYANDMPLMSAVLDPALRKGSGIIFSPSTMWGNPTRDVEVSNFLVKARPDFVHVPSVSEESRRNALTIPRFRRNNVPTHVLLAPNGDVLRGRIESAVNGVIKFQSGLDVIDVPMDRVASAVWLDKPKEPKPPESPDGKPAPPAAPESGSLIEGFAKDMASHWLVLHDGSRLAVKVDRFDKDRIKAWAPTLGEVNIPNDQLAMLKLSAPAPSSAMVAYQGWKAEFAAEPVLPETGGQSSPLLHKPAPDFALPLLGGAQFNLSAEKGKVIVLDFWATWCGPCVMSMPEQMKAMAQFDPAKVRFIAVNQGEPEAAVSKFLQVRGWQMEVALDSQQTVGQKYGAESIPHCVVIGPDGNVVWTNTGYNPGESEKMAGVIKKLLQGM